MKKLLLCLLCAWCCSLHAQMDVAVGDWKSYFSFNKGLDLLEYDNRIYVATTNALYTLDLRDGLYQRIDMSDGLTDLGERVL